MKPLQHVVNWLVRPHMYSSEYAQLVATLKEPHHTLGDMHGGPVFSSAIVRIHTDINVIETMNTLYKLHGKGVCELPKEMGDQLKNESEHAL